MAGDSGKKPIAVYGAIIANFAIAVAKFIAAAFTGSSAMISEGVHSLADSGNQALLLLGIHLSKRRPDKTHPFGYGKERYFWSLIVAIILFGVGGGISFYEGISHIRNPSEAVSVIWNYAVLGVAMVFEGISLTIAIREFLRKKKRDEGYWKALIQSKEPAIFVVLFEDFAALAGLIIAFLGVFLAQQFGAPIFDGIASVLIGIVLVSVATFLAYESRKLLLGESVDPEVAESLRKVVEKDEAVEKVDRLLTMHFGPDEVLLNLEVQFARSLSGKELGATLARVEERIQKNHPEVKNIFIEAEPLIRAEKREHQDGKKSD